MIILESTKVIIENLPKEEWWNSSLFTSIIGSIVGGLLAFRIAYIQIDDQRKQQDEQRNLEIRKIEIELKLKELDNYSKVVENLYYDISEIITVLIQQENIVVAKLEEHFNLNDEYTEIIENFKENSIYAELINRVKENYELTALIEILKEDHEYMELDKKIVKNIPKIANNIIYISKAFNSFFEPLYTEFTNILKKEQRDSRTFHDYSNLFKDYLIKKIPDERQKLIKSIYETKKELGK